MTQDSLFCQCGGFYVFFPTCYLRILYAGPLRGPTICIQRLVDGCRCQADTLLAPPRVTFAWARRREVVWPYVCKRLADIKTGHIPCGRQPKPPMNSANMERQERPRQGGVLPRGVWEAMGLSCPHTTQRVSPTPLALRRIPISTFTYQYKLVLCILCTYGQDVPVSVLIRKAVEDK